MKVTTTEEAIEFPITCSACGHNMWVTQEYAGKYARCSNCARMLKIIQGTEGQLEAIEATMQKTRTRSPAQPNKKGRKGVWRVITLLALILTLTPIFLNLPMFNLQDAPPNGAGPKANVPAGQNQPGVANQVRGFMAKDLIKNVGLAESGEAITVTGIVENIISTRDGSYLVHLEGLTQDERIETGQLFQGGRISCYGIPTKDVQKLHKGQHVQIVGFYSGRITDFGGKLLEQGNVRLDACQLNRILPAEELEPNTIKVSIATLIDTYGNELVGEKEFGGKRVKLFGIVSSGRTYGVYLKDPDTGQLARCYFRNRDDDAYLNNKIGFPVTIAATPTGFGTFGLFEVESCVLLTSRDEIERMVAEKEATAKAEANAELLRNEAEVQAGPVVVFKGDKNVIRNHPNFNNRISSNFGREGLSQVIVSFSGTCQKVRTSQYDDEISLVLKNDSEVEIECSFHGRHLPKLQTLQVGDTVTVHGRAYLYADFDVALTNCVIID